jgi:hypothetical protein
MIPIAKKAYIVPVLLVLSICSFLMVRICGFQKDKNVSNEKLCTELPSPKEQYELHTKGVAPISTIWQTSAEFPLNISVKFLNGTDFQKNKVRQYAQLWTQVSNHGSDPDPRKRKIILNFIPYDITTSGNTADIKIKFNDGGGSSSYIGSYCRQIAQDKPSMVFGWINENEPEISIKQVVLHEFGHALGLIHEHQNPTANIPWDKEKVYDYYYKTQSPPWERQKVDDNIFARYDATTTNYTQYDRFSIMHYAIPSSLTIGGYTTPWNSELSAKDIAFIRQIYPFYPCKVNVDCCFDKKTGKRIPCT